MTTIVLLIIYWKSFNNIIQLSCHILDVPNEQKRMNTKESKPTYSILHKNCISYLHTINFRRWKNAFYDVHNEDHNILYNLFISRLSYEILQMMILPCSSLKYVAYEMYRIINL